MYFLKIGKRTTKNISSLFLENLTIYNKVTIFIMEEYIYIYIYI